MVVLAITTAISVGCAPEPKITTHQVSKERSGHLALRGPKLTPASAENASRPAKQKTRMVVGLFEKPDATWFFKISGPAARVTETEDQWRPFLESVQFEDGKPNWKLPEGWTESGQKPMRYKTLVMGDGKPPIELAISSLGPDQDLLLNVNRWRKQLNLDDVTQRGLDEQLTKTKSADGEFLLFDQDGMGSGGMTPPFARGGAAPFASGAPMAQSPPSQPEAEQTQRRMVVGLFEQPSATWFFKITGPDDRVSSTEEQWSPFMKSIKFKDGKPVWELPEGWTESGPKPMRFQTLVMGDDKPPIELAISSLGPDQDLLLNVNRWRGQLKLEDIEQDELETALTKTESADGEFLLFDAKGSGSGSMSPPFAGRVNTEKKPAVQSTPSAPVAISIPEGWTSGKTSSMVPVRLQKKTENGEAMITIIKMPADANKWKPNVDRWAGQVGLSDLSDDKLNERTTTVTVDGVEGQMVDLIDLKSKNETGIVAGMVKRDGLAWFLKLSGDKKAVAESKDEFNDVVSSIKFK
jgi:hypothetical protein